MSLSNPIGTITELATGRGSERFTAPVGFNQKLFKGALWMLQKQAFLTAGAGNAALTVICRGDTPVSFAVQQQVGTIQALTHTYAAGALILMLGTDAGGAPDTKASAAAAYLTAQAGLQADFLGFIAGGDGQSIMAAATSLIFVKRKCWISGSDAALQQYCECPARGEGDNNGQSFIDNTIAVTGGLPGAVSASAVQSVYRLRNDETTPVVSVFDRCYLIGDDIVSADPGHPRHPIAGLSTFIFPDGSVAVDTMRGY